MHRAVESVKIALRFYRYRILRRKHRGTGRTLHKKPRTRPVKSAGAKRRRQKVQQKRLVTLGVGEDEARKMGPRKVRDMLKRPAAVKKAVASRAAKTAAAAEAASKA